MKTPNLISLFALSAAFVLSAATEDARPPNVLFILTEDQGAHLSFVGTPGVSTPNMDRIAESGVFFNRAFVNYPVCSPSKAGIYTGLYGVSNGLRGVTTNWHGNEDTMPAGIANHRLTKLNRIRDDFPTLVELLKGAGSTCAKWTGGEWKASGKVSIGYAGKHLECSVPNDLFEGGPGQGFDFKWVDNVSLESVESLFLEGDVAPDRRFNFRY